MRISTAADMQALGRTIGGLLRAGDLVILDGPLGAGKTTMTQGIADGLGVRGPVTSPTFVIARTHPSLVGGPSLVHVDAYRVGSWEELDDLGFGFDAAHVVTVAEWAHGRMDDLAEHRLVIHIARADDDTRTVRIEAIGARWEGVDVPARD